MMLATSLMRSADARDEPPNFITTVICNLPVYSRQVTNLCKHEAHIILGVQTISPKATKTPLQQTEMEPFDSFVRRFPPVRSLRQVAEACWSMRLAAQMFCIDDD